MSRRQMTIGGVLVVAVVVVAALFVRPGWGHGGPSPTSTAPPGATPSFTAGAIGSPPVAVDDGRRVAAILGAMHTRAYHADAPAPKNSNGVSGGTYINWGATWDGNSSTAAANTDFGSDGRADARAGQSVRHDEFTDLLYLRNLYGYRAAHPWDATYAGDIAHMDPVVRSDFAHYTYYKCSLYGELRDLDRFNPNHGWDTMASAYATGIFTTYYDSSRGTVLIPSKPGYRVDYAAECAVAMTDTGDRLHNAAMTVAGTSTARYLLSHVADSRTHMFPLQASAGAGGTDTVTQAQVKVGDEAQILDAFLTMYDLTQDPVFLTAVHDATVSMYSDGLYDTRNGGFFFSIDSNGTNLQDGYKEARQAWMLQVLTRLDQYEKGKWTEQRRQMLIVVRDRLWQAGSTGYVYRVSPDFQPYRSNAGPGHTPVVESWVTAEAMDIVAQVLEG